MELKMNGYEDDKFEQVMLLLSEVRDRIKVIDNGKGHRPEKDRRTLLLGKIDPNGRVYLIGYAYRPPHKPVQMFTFES
jgi:hypothetical protein